MGFLLTFLAGLGLWLFTPFLLIYSAIRYRSFKEADKHWMKIAISLDQLGNVVGSYFFNDTLIKKYGYQFGDEDDTISKVLGINKEMGDLTCVGKKLADALNKVDENHVEDAVKSDE